MASSVFFSTLFFTHHRWIICSRVNSLDSPSMWSFLCSRRYRNTHRVIRTSFLQYFFTILSVFASQVFFRSWRSLAPSAQESSVLPILTRDSATFVSLSLLLRSLYKRRKGSIDFLLRISSSACPYHTLLTSTGLSNQIWLYPMIQPGYSKR